ncbi:PREDICTED: neuron navigator 3-like [Priapulus caudatus]|uniref:Neuron navigator 3-like n=1 Tax=Priapulus caudatus TaxID=37621 RepID=A0ABM1DUX0_PRICU|nr:PREDICTED: neuron navigator 3-like [Priapulus caudatus]
MGAAPFDRPPYERPFPSEFIPRSPKKRAVDKQADILIGSIFVSGKSKWELLDNIVRRIFKEYVLRVDPVSSLGLSVDAVHSYSIGDVV